MLCELLNFILDFVSVVITVCMMLILFFRIHFEKNWKNSQKKAAFPQAATSSARLHQNNSEEPTAGSSRSDQEHITLPINPYKRKSASTETFSHEYINSERNQSFPASKNDFPVKGVSVNEQWKGSNDSSSRSLDGHSSSFEGNVS